MPDERMDSMLNGIGAPPESPIAGAAAARRRAELARDPAPAVEATEGALGGTSDAESAADEARMNAALDRGLPRDRTRGSDEPAQPDTTP